MPPPPLHWKDVASILAWQPRPYPAAAQLQQVLVQRQAAPLPAAAAQPQQALAQHPCPAGGGVPQEAPPLPPEVVPHSSIHASELHPSMLLARLDELTDDPEAVAAGITDDLVCTFTAYFNALPPGNQEGLVSVARMHELTGVRRWLGSAVLCSAA